MDVIPAVDVLNGKIVRLLRGDFDQVTVYSNDPTGGVASWAALGAPWVHVVDLEGARSGNPNRQLWESIGSLDIRFQIGGGIRDAELARAAVTSGAGRVVVGTMAVSNPALLAEVVDAVGPEAVVVAIDVKGNRSVGSGWCDEGRPWQAVVEDVATAGATRILVTEVSRDGTLTGLGLGLVTAVSRLVPELAVIASGGVRELADVAAAASADVEGVIVGRALYDGTISLEDAVAVACGL